MEMGGWPPDPCGVQGSFLTVTSGLRGLPWTQFHLLLVREPRGCDVFSRASVVVVVVAMGHILGVRDVFWHSAQHCASIFFVVSGREELGLVRAPLCGGN